MLGAIIGDIAGSRFEFSLKKPNYNVTLIHNKCVFTDDTVLTCAIADSFLRKIDFASSLIELARLYPNAGYGKGFYKWINRGKLLPYNSFGNGAAMRVSPVAYVYDNIKQVFEYAEKSAAVTHNHPEGIKGAKATAAAIFLSKIGKKKEFIKDYIERKFKYDLDFDYHDLIENYGFDQTCQGTVPQAIFCFLISKTFEDAIRISLTIGGDADTLTCITGAIAEAFYKEIPKNVINDVFKKLDKRLLKIVKKFNRKYVR